MASYDRHVHQSKGSTTMSEPHKLLKAVDDQQNSLGDFHSLIYMEQKEKDKVDTLFRVICQIGFFESLLSFSDRPLKVQRLSKSAPKDRSASSSFSKILGFHRLLSKRFPYAIYYQIESGDEAVVYRVLDCRQNPAKVRASLKSSR